MGVGTGRDILPADSDDRVFVLQSVVEYYLPSFANPPTSGINRYFALSLEGLSKGYVWQLLTYQLLPGGVWHLVFNLLAIYFLAGRWRKH